MTPTAARAFWLALVDNAARIIVEADALFPSPRAQSLVVLAQEEVGKAVWVFETFWSAWSGEDGTSLEVDEQRKQGRHHIAKLMKATDFHTAMIEVPDNDQPVDVELVKEFAPELLVAYSTKLAQEDNQAKQKGFYVDLEEDGSFTVPHEIERPYLRSHIWWAADMVKWLLVEDHLRASVTDRADPMTSEVEARLETILARDRGCPGSTSPNEGSGASGECAQENETSGAGAGPVDEVALRIEHDEALHAQDARRSPD